MTPRRIFVGKSESPVVIVDQATGAAGEIVETAAALAPFPAAQGVYYPGLRRIVTPRDEAAYAYVERLLEAAAPFIGGGFEVDGFDLVEASFSIVTTDPASLAPQQRAPHFDTLDPKHLALLHYLSDVPDSGTAFYRQRATAIERVTAANVDSFVWAARRTGEGLAGYIHGSNDHYEQIGLVEAVPDRLLVYPGSLLHSGVIPPGMLFSADPRVGRLTANIFVRGH
jgi:hypothetical protein